MIAVAATATLKGRHCPCGATTQSAPAPKGRTDTAGLVVVVVGERVAVVVVVGEVTVVAGRARGRCCGS